MHENTIKPYISIAGFPYRAILLEKGVGALDLCSEGLQPLISDSVRQSWPELAIAL